MTEERVTLESMPTGDEQYVRIEGMTGTYRVVYRTIFASDRLLKNIEYEDLVLPVSIHNGQERVFMGPHGYRNITLDTGTTPITTKGGYYASRREVVRKRFKKSSQYKKQKALKSRRRTGKPAKS